MKKQISAKNTVSSQRGVALLFALGILSVLMVLGLAFVSNALIAQKISVNNSNRSQADVMAQSAVNRILASTKLYSEYALWGNFQALKAESLTSRAKDAGKFNSDTTVTAGIANFGDLATINKVFGSVYDYDSTLFTDVDMPVPEWHLVFDSNGRVIGRYAYAVLPYNMFPQIDFTTVHSTMATPANGMTPKQMGHNVVFDPTNDWYSQFGLGTVPLNVIWRSYSQIFARQNVSAPNQLLVRRFFEVNYPPMIEAFRTTSGTTHTYYHRFNLFRTDWSTMTVSDLFGDNAALYWTAGTKNINTAETKALPFLARIGSDRGTFADPNGLTKRRKQIAANLIDYCINDTATAPTSDATQPWDLTTSIPTYTGNKQTDYIYEVGFEFNLIKNKTSSYNDNGFTISPNTPASSHTIQYSLGMLPIVKLVKMYKTTPGAYKFAGSLSQVALNGKLGKCSIEVVYWDNQSTPVQQTATLQFDVASSNISINSSWNNVQPTGQMDVTAGADSLGYKVQVPAQNFSAGGLRTDLSPTITVDTSNIASLSKVQALRGDATSIVSVKLVSIDEIEVSSVSATIDKMALFNSSGAIGFDYVSGPLNALNCATVFPLAKDADPAKNFKFALGSAKGIDPRQNLNPGDWNCSTSVSVTTNLDSANRFLLTDIMNVTSAGGGNYDGICNANAGANPQNLAASLNFNFDREAVTSPGYVDDTKMISSAKFPDSGVHTIKSPSEFGRIHRGAKWETINLSNADGVANDTTTLVTGSVSGSLDTAGSAYQEGDGGILDVIKSIDYSTIAVGSENEKYYTYGKVDLNCADGKGDPAVQTLPGDYMYANWLYRVVLDSAQIKAMVQKLNDHNNPTLRIRSEVLIINTLTHNGFYNAWGAFVPVNKAEMDELAGNLINTAEANPVPMVFKAIVKAQSVKDLGPETGTATITKIIDGTTDASVSITKGIFDGKGDEITGEVSYLVTFVRHPVTNQFFVVDKVQITE